MSKANGERFRKVLSDTHSQVRAYIAVMGVPLRDVDDIAQEVYIAFYKGMDKQPADASDIKWLKGIARNLAMNYFRKARQATGKEMDFLAEALAAHADKSPAVTEETEIGSFLKACMDKLPVENRKMLDMRYIDGHDCSYISEQLKKNVEAVRTALFRIREALKLCVENSMKRVGA